MLPLPPTPSHHIAVWCGPEFPGKVCLTSGKKTRNTKKDRVHDFCESGIRVYDIEVLSCYYRYRKMQELGSEKGVISKGRS